MICFDFVVYFDGVLRVLDLIRLYSHGSHDVQRPEPVPGPPGPAGRREGLGDGTLVRQGRGRQRERRAGRRREATRAAHHDQSQAAGDAEGGFHGHAEAHQAHPGAAVAGDGPDHESHPSKKTSRNT